MQNIVDYDTKNQTNDTISMVVRYLNARDLLMGDYELFWFLILGFGILILGFNILASIYIASKEFFLIFLGNLGKKLIYKPSFTLITLTISITLLKYIFYFPLFQTFFSFIFCRSSSPYLKKYNNSCYTGNHLFGFFISIFGLILLIIELVFINYTVVETNPFCNKSLRMYENITVNFDIGLTILVPLITILDGFYVRLLK